MKKTLRKVFSMKVSLIILGLLIGACLIGSFITQQMSEAYYLNNYPTFGHIIIALSLDDVFHTWWFICLSAFLCISLLGCNLIRFKSIYRQMQNLNLSHFRKNEAVIEVDEKPVELFKKMGFHQIEQQEHLIYASKNKIGYFGAWLCHLGILIIILGFGYGQASTQKYTVYGIVGEKLAVEDTNLQLTIDDFHVDLRDDETVEQYISQVTLDNIETKESEKGETSVNHPASLLGYKVYQNSTGYACDISFYVNDELSQKEVVYQGEYMSIEAIDGLHVLLRAFYPDFVMVNNQPMTQSSQLNNPGYLYAVYYKDQMIGMNVLNDDYISLDGPNGEACKITFDHPQPYSLLQIKKDPSTFVALIGGLITFLSLIICFEMPPCEMYSELEDRRWKIYIKSKKSTILLKDKLLSYVKEL